MAMFSSIGGASRSWRRRATAVSVLLGATALAVSLGGCTGFGTTASRASANASTSRSAQPLPDDLDALQLLALATAPQGSSDTVANVPLDPLAADYCGLSSLATNWWGAPALGSDSAMAWLGANVPSGMSQIVAITAPADSIAVTGYTLDAAGPTSTQGLLYSVYVNDGDGVIIRADAVSLPQGAACVAAAAKKAQSAASMTPSPSPGATINASAEQKAQQWLNLAVLPAGAVRASTQPTALLNLESSTWWCAPMATSTRYWTVPNIEVDVAANWLIEHPTDGLVVADPGQIPVSSVDDLTDVIEQPTATSVEGLAFTVARLGTGVAIRGVASVQADDATCATPPAGVQYAVGG